MSYRAAAGEQTRSSSTGDRAAARLRALVEVATWLSATAPDRDELAAMVVGHAAALLGDAATMWLVPAGAESLACVGRSHRDAEAHRLLAEIDAQVGYLMSDRTTRSVVLTGEPLVVADYDYRADADDRHPAYQPWLDRYGASAVAVLPMRARGQVVGALAMTRDAGGVGYTEEEVGFLQALADIAATSLDSAQLVAGSAAAQEELRRQTELIDHVSDAIIALDPDLRIVSWNAAAALTYQYSSGDAVGCDLFALLATACRGAGGEPMAVAAVVEATARSGGWRGELTERRADGVVVESRSAFFALRDSDGALASIVVVSRDVSSEHRRNQLAAQDAITGLPNHRLMFDSLGRALARAARSGTPVAVAVLGLDGYSQLRAELGGDAIDEVLRVTGGRLTGAVRGGDLVGRLGPDEFLVIAENVADDGSAVRRRILAAMGEPISAGDTRIAVRATVGIALSGPKAVEPDELILAADRARYGAAPPPPAGDPARPGVARPA